ncbi:MAG: HAMP domain-containing histidine kinase, partial [Polyangiaceae bacterium]|nr:HAMP domain-containing histidine kinase [Polyangiaceae bacterium]
SCGEPFDIECRLLRRADQAYRWHLLRAVPEVAYREHRGSWIVAGLDIEAQKGSERALARLLGQEQRAREAAEEANRMKDEFLATVSHELRTPLNAILGWASMIRTGAVDPGRMSRAIDIIERSARAQARLVQDILDVSRIVAGKLRLQVTSLDLVSVVSEAVETLRPGAEAKTIDLVWTPPPEPVRMLGDAARLQQVVWNLLSNAIKFTPKSGRVEVTLETSATEARVRVEDDGPGVPPEFVPFVFDRFRQADSTSTRAHEGLGLGLSIVKSLAEMHGGSAKLETPASGKGAAFFVSLPLAALPPTTQGPGGAASVEYGSRLWQGLSSSASPNPPRMSPGG